MRPLEPRPDVAPAPDADPRRAAGWGAAAVVLVVLTASHVLFLVSTARHGESGMAFSWFVTALLTPVLGLAAWRCARRSLAAARRPTPGPPDPAAEAPGRHESLRPDAPPTPRRW
ncbi:hypothetical protein KIN34_12085 [Cellulomonas sp. DKR-3]|uniref:Cardiolipin synthase N-terminal domain-containing protein n=1 Tax=Cellulomonas fulva TaxID=2835530 RepID=A0ABS5U0U0_9CELL|nr:hypothetical protein [Cellulomonas fulva]MBT0995020.1 hypothetical protein [Cellulomonas fulva]